MGRIDGGAFHVARAIFDNALWMHPTQLRIFLFLCGKAVFKREGVEIAGVHVPRGAWMGSYRKIVEGTAWIENNQLKEYSLSTVKRTTDELIERGRISKSETVICTLWKVENYDLYQTLSNYENGGLEQGLGTPSTCETANKINAETGKGTGTWNRGSDRALNNNKNDEECISSLFEKADGFLRTREIKYSSLILRKRMQSWGKLYEENVLSESFKKAAEAWKAGEKSGDFLRYLNTILQNDFPKKSEM